MVPVVEADADQLRRPRDGGEKTEPFERNAAGGFAESGLCNGRANLRPTRHDAKDVGKSKRGEADDAVEGEDAGFGDAAGALKRHKTHARKKSPWNVLRMWRTDRTEIISQIGDAERLPDGSLVP